MGREGAFTLTTVRSEGQFNSIVYEEKDTYRGAQTRWCVMMNPDDMAELGLDEGQLADVRSAQGRWRASPSMASTSAAAT